MFFTILIAFISLISLLVVHELGHFILAKRFGVRVDEFGIGYPPRLFGRKIGQTLYSLNLLPFGAFVRIYGEEESVTGTESFKQKHLWQRALIVLAGVVSFWVMSAVLLSVVMSLGVPTVIDDDITAVPGGAKVQIAAVEAGSPAQEAGLRAGDTLQKFSIFNNQFPIDKVKDVQELTEKYKGKEIVLTVVRGSNVFQVSLVPRLSPPPEQGPMGVALVRTAMEKYPWYQAPVRGLHSTANVTWLVIKGWGEALSKAIKGAPSGVQLMGPVGIFSLFAQVSELGINYFLQFVAIIAVHLALLNLLPLPAVDGGKLLFLALEKLRGKPINDKIEKQVNTFFFMALLALMVWVTIGDIARLF